MEKKRLLTIGFVALFLTFVLCGLSYSGEIGNSRFDANVVVAADETLSGGLTAGGANVEILGDVEGGLKAFGANVVIPGDVQGEVKAFGANVTLSGTFDGDVEVWAARITVTPAAVIKGDLIYATADLNIQKGSQIMGEVIQKQRMAKQDRVEKWGRRGILAIIPVGIFLWLVSVVALIIVGVIINYLFPKKTNDVIDTISQSPWKSLLFGFIFLVVVPFAIIIAFITVVGIPAGVIAGFLYGIAIYISFIYISVWIGRKVLGYIKKSMTKAFFWPLVAGTILIALISLIPVVGGFFNFFILLISLGALCTVMRKVVPAPVKKRTPRKVQRKTRKKK